MLVAKPTQLSGAEFLAQRDRALLADYPRVGKTGTALIAADYILADTILVVTTASGRGVWKAGFADWSRFQRKLQILTGGDRLRPDTRACVVSWNAITQAGVRAQLLARRWSLLILDEAHAAKNFETKRTQSVYGQLHRDGAEMFTASALMDKADVVWPLTGTPIPNSPLDAYPMMRALCPDRLAARPFLNWPDVTRYPDFEKRFAKTRPVKVGKGAWGKWINVFVEGRNIDELRARLDGFYLQRTQKDVGILAPEFEIMPLDGASPEISNEQAIHVLHAAREGRTKDLELHLGPLRRLTGEIKAGLVAEAIVEELDAGLNKVVLAYWHRDVGQILREKMSRFGVVGIDGSTQPTERTRAEQAFLRDPKVRVFLGQITAAGEAIDLSAASHLVFVETSFTPKDQLQMALRVTNHGQKQRPLVRVATLEGSLDDAMQRILLNKWTAINGVLGT